MANSIAAFIFYHKVGGLQAHLPKPSLPNIFVPQVGMRADELGHHLNAIGIIEDDDSHSMLPEQVFSSLEISVFPDDDSGNSEE
jgi:hypothetical protein